MEHIIHTIPPVYDKHSTRLILGTMPSSRSREADFYYGNKQNRLWKILEAVFDEKTGDSKEEKIEFLLKNRLAMWDVAAECDIEGAADSSIKNVMPNDFTGIFHVAAVAKVYTTGKAAFKLYQSLCSLKYNVPFYYLPSPSSANCAMSFEKIVSAYRVLL